MEEKTRWKYKGEIPSIEKQKGNERMGIEEKKPFYIFYKLNHSKKSFKRKTTSSSVTPKHNLRLQLETKSQVQHSKRNITKSKTLVIHIYTYHLQILIRGMSALHT